MEKFVGRQSDISLLNDVASRPGSQLILVYGRRRVGKTTLLLHWAEQTGRPVIYWVATRDAPAQLRLSFSKALWSWAYPPEPSESGMSLDAVPRFDSWEDVFKMTARLIGDQRVVLIMDEFSYAAESDPSLPSNLQAAWDHHFKQRNLILVLAGSHIGTMVNQMSYNAPLYGRFTAQLPVDPLPFGALVDFLPGFAATERVAVYAVTGGVPAYLEQLNDSETVGANLKRLFIRRTGMFRSEPFLLVGDVIRRETQTYQSVLKAIAGGQRTPSEIGLTLDLPASYLSPYLKQLEALRLVERRIPATVPLERRAASRNSRYHLADPYLRFYFRFIDPNLELVEQDLVDVLWDRIAEQFRAFVGATAFEEVCREWVRTQVRARRLPLVPQIVGSHWAADAQVDVVAVNWQDKAILLGECKWGADLVGRSVIRELIDKAPKVMPAPDWQVHYLFFAREGFTDAATAEAGAIGATLVDMTRLDADLHAGHLI